ncbi:MAG: hypothetical protein II855_02695 [Candidatus Methanomethylophilaceae archaeon]|nr:hypothetical protein [Candidatus Methanomethylophilaceae archaeon]
MTDSFDVFRHIDGFCDSVKRRDKTDLIMHIPLTLLILFMPLIVFAVVEIMAAVGGRFDVINDYNEAAILDLMLIQYLVAAVVLFRMYDRLHSHSRRDYAWRKSLMRMLRERNVDVTRPEEIDKRIRKQERFILRVPAMVALFLMFLFTMILLVLYVPDMVAHGYVPSGEIAKTISDIILDNTISFTDERDSFTNVFLSIQVIDICLLLIIYLMTVFGTIGFPSRHEKEQAAFTESIQNGFSGMPRGHCYSPMMVISNRRFALSHVWYKSTMGKIVLSVGTLGLYPMYCALVSMSVMNTHLQNQWSYEENLMKYVATDSAEGFEEGGYAEAVQQINSVFSGNSRRAIREQLREAIKEENRMPIVLVLAELFVMVLCACYSLKIVSMNFEMISDYADYLIDPDNLTKVPITSWVTMGLIGLDLYLMIATMGALLGIASKRPASWKKVTKSCVTFIVPLWIAYFFTDMGGFGHLFDFNIFITTGVLYIVLLMMILSVKIKEYYAPVGEDMPGTFRWLRYILWGDL